ncbi:MAG: c-type cytochrome [Nitrospinae bacterium]|nr:c-type cytochrome [Nitrospinota bacterium]
MAVRRAFIGLAAGFFSLLTCAVAPGGGSAWAADKAVAARELEILQPRVPQNRLAKAKALKNPLTINAEAVARGGSIYKARGTCVVCHGARGRGDGDMGAMFDPPPRDFKHAAWQSARTDGEIFWAIKYGTEEGMPRFEGKLSDEEMWGLVAYLRSLGK